MTFEQTENGLEMTCVVVTTDASAKDQFCDADAGRPQAYIVQGYADCSTIPSSETVQAQAIATLNSPSKK